MGAVLAEASARAEGEQRVWVLSAERGAVPDRGRLKGRRLWAVRGSCAGRRVAPFPTGSRTWPGHAEIPHGHIFSRASF